MWKIGPGYVLLLAWCYLRAEISRRRAARRAADAAQPALSGSAASAATLGAASAPPATRSDVTLRWVSAVILTAGVVLVVWGSGYNCLFWLPAGLALTALIQTLLPIRRSWR